MDYNSAQINQIRGYSSQKSNSFLKDLLIENFSSVETGRYPSESLEGVGERLGTPILF